MIEDERIQSSTRRITHQVFVIWYILMLASLLYRIFYLKQPIEQYWDLAAIFVIGCLFGTISVFSQGAVHKDFFKIFYKVMIPIIIIIMFAVSYFFCNIKSITQLIVIIISSLIVFSLVVLVFYILYKSWERRI